MPAYRARADIAAPPEVVFEAVADLARHGEWSADPIVVTPDGPDRFRSSVTAKGKQIEATLTVVERRPPERFVFDATDITGSWRHTFTLTPTARGTRIEREIAGSLSGTQLLLYGLVVLPIKIPNARRALARLKALVEGGRRDI